MTCIVGIKHDGHVYIGTDSRVSSIPSGAIVYLEAGKLVKIGKLLVGCAGSFAAVQTLRHAIPKVDLTGKPNDAMYKFTRELRRHIVDSGQDERGGHYMAAWGSNLYEIDSDFAFAQASADTLAIGNGAEYAFGALYATAHITDPRKRITIALEAAAHYDSMTAPPFIIERT